MMRTLCSIAVAFVSIALKFKRFKPNSRIGTLNLEVLGGGKAQPEQHQIIASVDQLLCKNTSKYNLF
jgi:hypothetical protein